MSAPSTSVGTKARKAFSKSGSPQTAGVTANGATASTLSSHYHSKIHEVLGIARGRARVQLGGPRGGVFEFAVGDVVVLPAGTGHQKLSGSDDLVVIGAYPPEGTYNLCRGDNPAEHDKALTTIPRVPLPDSDPVLGKNGPLPKLWRSGTSAIG